MKRRNVDEILNNLPTERIDVGRISLAEMWERVQEYVMSESRNRKSRAKVREKIKKSVLVFNCDNVEASKLEIMLPTLNDLIFEQKQTSESLLQCLCCKSNKPLKVKNNRYLAFWLNLMSECYYIGSNWAQIAGERGLFVSRKGNVITTSNLTTSLHRFNNKPIYVGEDAEEKAKILLRDAVYRSVYYERWNSNG